jgi:hypothetical protein
MSGPVPSWLIAKSNAVPPLSGTVDSAYRVQVVRGDSTRDVVVEFTAPSSLTSVGYAEEVTRPYLSGSEPPRHLVVDIRGSVHVLLGPLDAAQDHHRPSPRETSRARPRHRR